MLYMCPGNVTAQPSNTVTTDTLGLKPQKENIITPETILKIENIGAINTQSPELRPTISADVSKGISANRIASNGYGETKPVATNDTDEGRQLNRRVEFTIIKN